ncbi:MAG: carboxypeptidase-like regulatory domain-containing protein [Marinilabiliales bacterium]|nr:carboxypeptidase-like regulatory domain-containing protein [Marinilabiliales bacterium]
MTSPTAIGIANSITSKSGRYAISGLVPGSYKVVAEMPGFKTVTVEGVALSAGMTVSLDFRMQPTDIEEEPTTERPGPPLDRDSARTAVVLDKDLITRLPLARDFTALLSLVPGLVFENDKPGMRASLQGAPVTANVLVEDGVIVTHPVDARAFGPINVDIIDEVVVETAGHPVEAGPAQGAYINILHHPGARRDHGQPVLRRLRQGPGRLPLEGGRDRRDGRGGAPSLKREHDLSLTYGGPCSRTWPGCFANVRYRTLGYQAPYRYWTDPTGGRNFVFDSREPRTIGPVQDADERPQHVQGRAGVRLLQGRPARLRDGRSTPSVRKRRPAALDGEHALPARFGGSYAVNQDTRIDFSLGYAKYAQPAHPQRPGGLKPEYYDVDHRAAAGAADSVNDREKANRMRAGVVRHPLPGRVPGHVPRDRPSAATTRRPSTTSETWKADNLIYNYADGSPYTYGTDRLAGLRGGGRLGPRRVLHRAGGRDHHDPQARAQAHRRLRPGHGQDRRPHLALGRPPLRPVRRPFRVRLQGLVRQLRQLSRGQHPHRSAHGLQPLQLGQPRRVGEGHRLELPVAPRGAGDRPLRQRPDRPQGLLGPHPGVPGARLFPGPVPHRSPGLPRLRLVRRGRRRPRRYDRHLRARLLRLPRLQERVSSSRPSTPTSPPRSSRSGRPAWSSRSPATSPSPPGTSSAARRTTSGTSSTIPRPGPAGGGSTRPRTAGGSPSRPSCRARTATPTSR